MKSRGERKKHDEVAALREVALHLHGLFPTGTDLESRTLSGEEVLGKILEELEPRLADAMVLLTRTARASTVPDETRRHAAAFLFNLAHFASRRLDSLAASAPDLLRGIAADERTAPALARKGKDGAQRQKEFLQLIELAENVPEPRRKRKGGVIPAIAQCILDAIHEARCSHEDNVYLLGECLTEAWASLARDLGDAELPAIEESSFWEFEQPGELPELASMDRNPQEIWMAYCRRIFLKIFGDTPADAFPKLFEKEIALNSRNQKAGTSPNDAILQRFAARVQDRLKSLPQR